MNSLTIARVVQFESRGVHSDNSCSVISRVVTSAILVLLIASTVVAQPTLPTPKKIGNYERTIAPLQAPAGVAIADDGTVFVSESFADRVVATKLDGSTTYIGHSGSDISGLLAPADLALSDGRLYIVDRGNHRIQIAKLDGQFVGSFGGHGVNPGRLTRPSGIAVVGERVYVADTGNHRIQVFNLRGEPALTIGEYGHEPGQFIEPSDVAVAPDGSIFVSDMLNCRIQRFDAEGKLIKAWGEPGFAPGMLAEPESLIVLGDELLVADTRNHRAQLYSFDGEFLGSWGLPALRPREGDGLLHYPSRIGANAAGDTLAVAETFENRVQIFRLAEPTTTQRRPPAPLDMSTVPHYDLRGAIHGPLMAVIEPDTNAVLIFDMRRDLPVLTSKLGAYGVGYGKFIRPTDVVFDARGRLWVLDSGNQRLQAFDLDFAAEAEPKYQPFMCRFVKAFDLRTLHGVVPHLALNTAMSFSAIECDGDGGFVLLDQNNGLILSLSAEFEPRHVCGGFGAEKGKFLGAVEMSWDRDGATLLVVDTLAGTITSLDPHNGTTSGVIQIPRNEGDLPRRPFGVFRDDAGELLVTDQALNTIHRFAQDGTSLGMWGKEGLARGEFYKPGAMLRDAKNRLIVIDAGNHRLQFFTPKREFLDAFGARLFVQPTRKP